MAYLPTGPISNPVTGESPPAAWGDQINDNFDVLEGPAALDGTWDTYTAFMTAATTNPTVTSDSANFLRIGNLGIIQVQVTIVTPGVGQYQMGLPPGWTAVATANQMVPGLFFDAAPSNNYPLMWRVSTGGVFAFRADAVNTTITSTSPVTVAAGDMFGLGPSILHLA